MIIKRMFLLYLIRDQPRQLRDHIFKIGPLSLAKMLKERKMITDLLVGDATVYLKCLAILRAKGEIVSALDESIIEK